jgi:hypothetical protein
MRAVVIGAAIAPDDISSLCERVRRLMADADPRVVVCDVGGLESADAGTVEALARLRLVARRVGGDILLRGATDELIGLIAFMGLADVIRCGGSGLETRGQPE